MYVCMYDSAVQLLYNLIGFYWEWMSESAKFKNQTSSPRRDFQSTRKSRFTQSGLLLMGKKKKKKKLITLAHPHRNAGLLGYFHLKPLATRYLLTLSMSWARGATKVQRKTFTGVIQIIICMRFQHYNQHTTLFHSFIHFPATYFPRPARPFVKECRPDAVTTPVFALQGPSDASLLSRGQI